MTYFFETDDFGITDNDIHYLRNRFNYKTVNFSDIDKIEIKKGSSVKNFYTLLIFGIFLICFAFYSGYNIIHFLFFEGGHIYIQEIVVPVIPLLFGSYCIYNCIKKSIIMVVTFENSHSVFDIDSIVKNSQLNEFIIVLQKKLGANKLVISNIK
jgi:hypothetical protein